VIDGLMIGDWIDDCRLNCRFAICDLMIWRFADLRGTKMRWIFCVALAALVTGGCGAATSPTATTGLAGTVERGPIAPVCVVNVSCSAPFSAAFTVDRTGTVVAQFRSDNNGQFTVSLSPGTYHVTPGDDAPLLAPATQVKTVTVIDSGLTMVKLEFDTGIR
jgi:hypothetical protein